MSVCESNFFGGDKKLLHRVDNRPKWKKKQKTKKTFLFSAKKVSVWTGHSSLLVIVRLLADTHILSLSHNVTKNNTVVKLLLSFLIYSEIKRKKRGRGFLVINETISLLIFFKSVNLKINQCFFFFNYTNVKFIQRHLSFPITDNK